MNTKSKKLISIVAISMFALSVASGEEKTLETVAKGQTMNRLAALEDPGLNSSGLSNTESAALSFDNNDSNISLKFGQHIGGNLSLKGLVSFPLDEDQKTEIGLGDFDSLSNSRSLGFELQYTQWPIVNIAAIDTSEICSALTNKAQNKLDLARTRVAVAKLEINRLTGEIPEGERSTNISFQAAKIELSNAEGRLKIIDLEFDNSLTCTDSSFDNVSNQELFEELAGYNKAINMFGIKYEAGKESFDYVTENSFMDMSVDESNYEATIYWGRLSKDKSRFVAIGATTQQGHKAGQAQQICNPVGEMGSLICDSKIVGSPARSNSELGYIEYKKKFKNIAVAPKVTFNFENDETGIALPIWFATKPENPSESSQFKTGVRIDWNSESEETVASIVFGQSFKLFGEF